MSDTQQKQEKGTVLLLDDDKFLLDMYAQKFMQAGFRVHAALSSADALKALRDGFAANAIVFDLIMPEGDGFSFLDALQKEGIAKAAVKIALTNQMSEEEKTKVLSLGAANYLVKATMIPSEVVATVSKEIAKARK